MGKTLIIYFSNTNTTKRVAEMMAKEINADLYRIQEMEKYSDDDLNWNNPNSRANIEQGDDSSRPEYKGELPKIQNYSKVIIAHPIWWGRPPRIIQTVIEDLDLRNAKVASFATSGGSTYNASSEIMDSYFKGEIKGKVLRDSGSIRLWIKNF